MFEISFNNYGYSNDTYKECRDLIVASNRRFLICIVSCLFFVISVYLALSLSNLLGYTSSQIKYYAAYLTATFIVGACLIFFPVIVEKYNVFFVYTTIFLMFSFGILYSVLRPYMPAVTYQIIVLLCAISYIDKMVRFTTILTLSTAMFIFTSFKFKTFSIAYYDTYTATLVAILVSVIHYTFQRAKIKQFVLYKRNLHLQQELEIKSSFDSLTALLARAKFFSVAEEVLRHRDNEYQALCLMDLDGFKQINDTLGHQAGDKAIQLTGAAIIEHLNTENFDKWTLYERLTQEKISFAGRLGGDEFIIFVRGKNNKDGVIEFLSEIMESLSKIELDEIKGLHASFGFTEITRADTDIDNAYKRADEALYKSKRAGKNQIHYAEEL